MGQQGQGLAESQGQATGIALHDSGINVDLAPVADVAHSASSFIWKQQRSFGMSPATVAAGAGGFAAGLQTEGVAATAKHFPGAGMFLDGHRQRPAAHGSRSRASTSRPTTS